MGRRFVKRYGHIREKNMQNRAIQVKGLQKSYKKLHVLKDVDFEVEKGSIFALLGSNGGQNDNCQNP